MKKSLSLRWLASPSVLLVVFAALLGVGMHIGELDVDLLSLIDLPTLEEEVSYGAVDVLMFILLTCFLIHLVAELLRSQVLPAPPRVLALKGKELLFDHGSRAPPRPI